MSVNPIVSPAAQLTGRTLDGGWQVLEPLSRTQDQTGGHFSHGYRVRRDDGTEAFLKALDFSEALKMPDPARVLQALTTAFNFERDLLYRCRERKLRRIVRPLDAGSVTIDGYGPAGVVQYLVLEKAEGDLRARLASANFDLAFRLRALHHIAVGMRQLHSIGIAHQDLKPSNVLQFPEAGSKLTDLGRAGANDSPAPHDHFTIAGDKTYAPPELLYGFVLPDWEPRRLGCDVYLLGSMIVFLFSGYSMTGLLFGKLDQQFRFDRWGGGYEAVLPYVQDAFDRAVEEFSAGALPEDVRGALESALRELCNPDPRQRGRRSGFQHVSPFDLGSYVTLFDLLAGRAEFRLKRGGTE